jgi:hypothetical protein
MVDDKDKEIQLAAERFIARYGDEAPAQARRRANELAEAGHSASAAEWERIAALAEGLLAAPGGTATRLH